MELTAAAAALAADYDRVTEGTGNTVHLAERTINGARPATWCNREPFTTRNKLRTFRPSSHPLTCKRCGRIAEQLAAH